MNEDAFRRRIARMAAAEGDTLSAEIVTRRFAWRLCADRLSRCLAQIAPRVAASLAHRMLRRRLLGR
jgi:hypothetical protein